MEKYGQYRDKGSGIAPFFPVAPPPSNPLVAPYHVFLFFLRLPFFIFAWAVWLLIIQWAPAGSILRKANLWCIIGIPGIWFVDIRVDGVQRGSLGKTIAKLPTPGCIIASSFTSPVDIVYLAAIFDPIFVQSFPGTRRVKQITLATAVLSCFFLNPSPEGSIELSQIMANDPSRTVVVFPEGTTSNGRGILRPTPSLLSAGRATSIFPVSIKYTPSDIVAPIPGWVEIPRFLWKLSSRQTHCIRVRVGLPLTIATIHQEENGSREARPRQQNGYDTNFFDSLKAAETSEVDEEPTASEQNVLNVIVDQLARLGRVKTLGLGVDEKIEFVNAWQGKTKSKKRR
ncbi:putative phospholipid/glycerol acyltransferase [Septoria linicola]|nr:putative phospholipid/glycerol acyltransferase [Septoria linicola]